jgi:hypothetical protein
MENKTKKTIKNSIGKIHIGNSKSKKKSIVQKYFLLVDKSLNRYCLLIFFSCWVGQWTDWMQDSFVDS